ncbi:MAG TPA: hypothetical protein VGB17_02890 [Pyrinomonadaceae bacterium]|jgi:hypothetical protein
MARFLLEDAEIIYSAAPETAVNTPYTTSADFKSALVNSMMPPVPQLGKIKDNQVGGANEWGRKSRNIYWQPFDLPIGGMLNTEIAAALAARAFGGSTTNTVITTGASWDHFVALQTKAQGRIPKLTTLAFLLGGYDFLHASLAVDTFEINFGGDASPEWSATLRNTGNSFQRVGDLDPAIVVPSLPSYHYMHPAAILATFNDGSLRDFAADARLISGRCGIGNSIVVKPHPGDPFRTAGDRRTGAYMRDIHRGKRTYTPTIKVSMDEDLAEWVTARDNTDITDLTFVFKGDPIGVTPESYEFEIKYPLSNLMVESDTDDTDAALNLSFDIDREDASGGIAILRVRNGSATLV